MSQLRKSSSVVSQLLNATPQPCDQRTTEQGRRDHGVLLFLYNTGARASEAAAVAVRDLDVRSDGSGSVRLVGKGGKTRHCPLWPATMTSLRALTQGRSADEPVFRNRRRTPVTRFVVHATVARYVTEAAIACPSIAKKAISPHVIRHTTATHLLRAGVDINTIRAWLGHVSIETTNVYAEIDLEMKAKALKMCEAKRKQKRWRDKPDLLAFLSQLRTGRVGVLHSASERQIAPCDGEATHDTRAQRRFRPSPVARRAPSAPSCSVSTLPLDLESRSASRN